MKKGTRHTIESKIKNSFAHKGKRVGEQNNKWKGDKVGYGGLHDWIRLHYGKASKCENKKCTYKNPKRYHWANLSGKYKRDRNDWMQLCPSCHIKMDKKEKIFCRNGHPQKDNTIVDNRKSLICKTCKRENAHKDYLKNKDKIIKRITERRRLLRSTIKR